MFIVSIALALLPALVLVFYFYRKDSLKREPAHMIRRAFFFGILSIVPAIILELAVSPLEGLANPWMRAFIRAFFIAALMEEASKLIVLRLFLFKNPNFDEVTDGIVYMAIVSLGFACFENIVYSAGDIGTGFIRAFTAVPGHAIWSGIMGYYIGCAKVQKKNTMTLFMNGLSWGILYHGLYDFFLFAGSSPELSGTYLWLALLILPLLLVGWFHLRQLIRKAQAEDRASGFTTAV